MKSYVLVVNYCVDLTVTVNKSGIDFGIYTLRPCHKRHVE